ncbi:hypothetical protein JOD54_000827 [Actinokineospora baliensis]|uniref:hypothetical protein n=1 Tax=Actinokineospora baliensis TaxID=547056 RepID=UPI001959F5ED|nr:hypothetical protein [Actinokineospora baliensis]MBM7770623.1 hypothetical protein [Actinokineospora baliensis]
MLFRDVLSGVIHGELPAEKFSYTTTLNAPGSASFTIDLSPTLRHVTPYTVVAGGATALYVERDDRVVWSGLLWNTRPDYAAGTLELACEGWLSYYRSRHYHATTRFSGVDQAEIARSLLRHAANYGTGSNLGMIRFGDETHDVPRDRTYKQSERKPIGEAVEQLAAVSNGFDFSFTSEWDGRELWTWFRTHYPATGRERDITLEQGRSCDIPTATVGGTSVVTHAYAIGSGDGADQVAASAGTPSPIFPRLEAVDTYGDVKEFPTLLAKAEQRVRLGRAPILLPTIDLHPGGVGLDEFDLGDALTVIGGYGLVPIDGRFRITDVAVSVDENSAESISLTAAPREVFGTDE